mgnify:CR=1 FL=1
MDSNELKMVLERIASALEKQNDLMEKRDLRQRKIDSMTYEGLKQAKK